MWPEYFEEVMNGGQERTDHVSELTCKVTEECVQVMEPSIEELERPVAVLKTNKALVEDDVVSELIKCRGGGLKREF